MSPLGDLHAEHPDQPAKNKERFPMKKPRDESTHLEPILKLIMKFKGRRFQLD
jgi:hypothetical protein